MYVLNLNPRIIPIKWFIWQKGYVQKYPSSHESFSLTLMYKVEGLRLESAKKDNQGKLTNQDMYEILLGIQTVWSNLLLFHRLFYAESYTTPQL